METVDATSAVSRLLKDVIGLFGIPGLDGLLRFVFVVEIGIPIEVFTHVPIRADILPLLGGSMSAVATTSPIGC